LFVGATEAPRRLAVADGRERGWLHWHMCYVVVVT